MQLRRKQPNFKKAIAILLSVLMLLVQMPLSVFATDLPAEVPETPPASSHEPEVSPDAPSEPEVDVPEGVLALGVGVTVTEETVYSFTPDVSGVYCFYSERLGDSDPVVYLLDNDMNLLAQDDDGGGNLNFELHYALTAGETYYVEASAYSARYGYTLTVEESNITGIEIVSLPTVEVMENDYRYGNWYTVYNNEIVDRYFRYYLGESLYEAVILVHYKDGTSQEITYFDEYGEWSGMSTDWDFYNNPWVVGTDNHCYITYKGFKALVDITVIPSDVTSIELVSIDNLEYVELDESRGYWTNYYFSLELEEPYFNYAIESLSDSIVLKVTYTDGTTEEVVQYTEEKGYAGIYVYADQYLNPWSLGENEFEIWYRGACITATATVVESPVESIRVLPGSYEYTEGDTMAGHWMENGYFYYYPYLFVNSLTLEVTYKDGTVAEVYVGEEGGVTQQSDQYENPWTVDGTNEIVIQYMGASTVAHVTVKPGLVASIAVENVVVTEGTNGSYWGQDTEDGTIYWYHYNVFAQDISVTLNDGTVLRGDNEYIWSELGVSISLEPRIYQNYRNPWGVGEYVIVATLMGKRCEFLYIIEESDVVSITVENLTLEQNHSGYWESGYWENDEWVDAEWFRYQPDQAQMTVVFKDRSVYKGSIANFSHESLSAQCMTTQSYHNPWLPGGTYTATVCLGGKQVDYSVTIEESNIRSIEVIDTNGFVYYENDTRYGNWQEDFFWYSPWYLAREITIRVTYKDGSTEDVSYYDEYDNYTGIEFSSNQWDAPWSVGGENKVDIIYGGAKTTISAVVEPCPIKDIQVEPIVFTKYTGGWWNSFGHEDENGNWIEESRYYYYSCEPQYITITFTNGTQVSGTPHDIEKLTGYYPEWSSDQAPDNHWDAGEHTATLYFMGVAADYTVIIEESAIASITAPDVTIVEGTNGWWNQKVYWDDNDERIETGEFYYFYGIEPQEITVTFRDGTVITGTLDEIGQLTGENPSIHYNQGQDSVWGVGTHTVSLYLMGAEGSFEVEITPSPVKSIEVQPITYTEYTNGWFTEDDGVRYYRYSCRPEQVTITYEDGRVITGTADEIEDQTGYVVDYFHAQNRRNPWGIGTHTSTAAFMGKTAEYTVEITPSPIESIVVEPLFIEDGSNGWWNHYEGGYYLSYDLRPQNITVYYTDGSSVSGSYDELYELAQGDIDFYAYQEGPWAPGTYTGTFTFMGKEVTYDIIIEESRIESITVLPVIRIEGENGWWSTYEQYLPDTDEWVYGKWFCYSSEPYEIIVRFKDGSVFTGSAEGLAREGYTVRWDYDQSYENQWYVGAHTAYLQVGNTVIPYTVEIVEKIVSKLDNHAYGVLSDGTAVLLEYHGSGNVVVPETIDGYTVTVLYSNFLWNHDGTTNNVSIPGTVKRICENSFGSCYWLESIRLHSGLEIIGYCAFGDCYNLTRVVFVGTEEEWDALTLFRSNDYLTEAERIFGDECAEHVYDDPCDAECNVCFAIREDAHSFEWIIDYKGTCTEDGWMHKACTLCGYGCDYDTTIPAKGTHENTELIDYNDPTCGQWGYTGDLYCHDCDCYVEYGTEIEPTGEHMNVERFYEEEATCGRWGYTGDLFCNDCRCWFESGESIEPTGKHEHVDVTNQYDATCGQEGYTGDLYCYDCGNILALGETIPQKDHENTELIRQSDPTCGSDGYTGDLYCYDCWETIEYGEILPATGEHKETAWTDGYDATCTEDGYTGILICLECKTIVEYGDIIPASGEHKNTEWIDGYDATCGSDGYTGDLYCYDCWEILEYGETIPATGEHSSLTIIGACNATCSQTGYTGDVMCRRCKTIVEYGEVIPATGQHVYDNNYDTDCNECGAGRDVATKPATLTLTGGTVYQGDTIRVDVSVSGNAGFAALQFGLLYDNTYLTLSDVETEMEDFFITVGNSIVFDSFQNYVADGVIATLVFTVAEDAPVGNYAMYLRFMSASNEDFEAVVMSDASTTITVESAVIGDANGDGYIDTIDLVMLRKYLAYMDPLTKTSEIEVKKGADTNGDGVIDAIDLAFVRQYLASMTAE